MAMTNAQRLTALEATAALHTERFDRLENMLQRLLDQQPPPQPQPPPPPGYGDGILPNPPANRAGFLPRLDFPYFSGSDPSGWLRKCSKLFLIHHIAADQQVDLVSLYLEDRADVWFQGWSSGKETLVWEEFSAELLRRFGDSGSLNIVGAFNKLRQTGTVIAYQERFEELRSQMLRLNPALGEEYFVKSFISGLDDEIQPVLMMMEPANLTTAFLQARMEESSMEARKKKVRIVPRWSAADTGQQRRPFPPRPPAGNTSLTKGSGLCYKCGDKWHYGHICSKKKLNALEGEVLEEGEASDPNLELEDDEQPEGQKEQDEDEVHLRALDGHNTGSSIKLLGEVGAAELMILVDTGSSHTFLSHQMAMKLKCQLQPAPTMKVRVANGEALLSKAICKGFTWTMQNRIFNFDVRILHMENDMVLGFDWLRTISPVEMDFEQLSMVIKWKGETLKLQGLSRKGHCKVMTSKEFQKLITQPETPILLGQLQQLKGEMMEEGVPDFLAKVVEDYTDVFKVPTGLPPSRNCDHGIPLNTEQKVVNLRPYRYSPAQKDEIERLVKEMLLTEVIQPSHSPFASPVLLVLKKDGSWRFCVDYRELNALTIKDKFPIPVIEDLLDELQGAAYFTKLDLRAGYHQIRMLPEDQYKTAFRTHHGHYEFRVMPFGLTNAPATFQSVMNQVLAPYLRKFVLVFFDDILIYSPTQEQHQEHLSKTLQLLRENQFYAKRSKCSFGKAQVEYLGHVVTKEGVATDQEKIKAMIQWPVPTSIRGLRGFLGLTGYYRKFIKGYSIISKPLTDLLKKNQFKWSEDSTKAFEELKKAMTEAPVLALPDYSVPFTLETDASGTGIGAVLAQQGRPVAYLSQALSPKNQTLSTYEKEYLAVILAVARWRHYLEGRHFTILTDHQSLKYLLEQRLHTQIQKKGLLKLMGLDFDIKYRQGKLNKAADALSRVGEEDQCLGITAVTPEWKLELEDSYQGDTDIQELIAACAASPGGPNLHYFEAGLLRYKGTICVGKGGTLRKQLLELFHASPVGGHSGMQATYQRVKQYFYWEGMKTEVTKLVAECDICKRCKAENVPYPGLLQPLPVPDQAWKHISMDFIDGLPKTGGKDVILVVIDRFTKYGHFIALTHPYTAVSVSQSFMEGVFKLHGMPETIVTDRDVVFTSTFWKELFKLQGTKLHYSTAYHPQTDGQTERLNRCLEDYLRCMILDQPRTWKQWLAMAEWWYNTNFHTSLKITPFEALYGYPPSAFSVQNPLSTAVAAVEEKLQHQHQLISHLRDNLATAQNRQKQFADRRRTEREFQVGSWVYLKLHPYRQGTVANRANQKISPRYFGPFLIIQRVGSVAYRLKLPKEAQIHPVFHVSLLKGAVTPDTVVQATLPQLDEKGKMKLAPAAILARRFIKENNAAVTEVLIQWSHQTEADATWEKLTKLQEDYPEFQT
ncbi:Transposon Tf2-6 polyprotein [Linum grandiflorum]